MQESKARLTREKTIISPNKGGNEIRARISWLPFTLQGGQDIAFSTVRKKPGETRAKGTRKKGVGPLLSLPASIPSLAPDTLAFSTPSHRLFLPPPFHIEPPFFLRSRPTQFSCFVLIDPSMRQRTKTRSFI